MKKVLSFSLWGNEPKYTLGAIENAKLALVHYPNWECWFYLHSSSIPNHIKDQLLSFSHVKCIFKHELVLPTTWRFEAIDDPEVEVMACRDCDSRLSTREQEAITQWLDSSCLFHIMRDHPHHIHLILAGMFDTRKLPHISWKTKLQEYTRPYHREFDMEFLRDVIYPCIKTSCLTHDSFYDVEKNTQPFPSPYSSSLFHVGGYINETNSPSSFHLQELSHSLLPKLKPTCVVLSCDDNPLYYEFYPIVREAWKTIVGIPVRLWFIGTQLPLLLKPYSAEIQILPPSSLPSSFLSQMVRLYSCSLGNYSDDEVILTGDIDMIPMNRKYFMETCSSIDTSHFVNLRYPCKELAPNQLAICYNIATSKLWKTLFPKESWENLKNIYTFYSSLSPSLPLQETQLWYADQLHLFEVIKIWSQTTKKFVGLTDDQTSFHRLDRISPDIFSFPKDKQDKIKYGYYSDYHLLRPYSEYEYHIRYVLQLVSH